MKHLIAFALIFVWLGSAQAQQPVPPSDTKNQGKIVTPPKSVEGETFKASADRRWQRTQGEYLSKSADTEKKVPDPKENEPARDISVKTAQWIAFFVLAVLIISVLFFWWNNRTGGGLFRTEAKEDRFAEAILKEAVGSTEGEAISLDDLTYEKLKSMADTTQGLRLLLLHGLKRAAGENNIPLRRSLTTRDIFARVPDGWNHRNALANIVAHAEPVLFGGRMLDQQKYVELLEASKSLFTKTGFRGFG